MISKIKISILILTLCLSFNTKGQNSDSLSLHDCYVLARQHAPQLNILNLNKERMEIEAKKLDAKKRPHISAYGKLSYQSDAMEVVFPVPGGVGLEVEKLQYNAGININQMIYGGGLLNLQKKIKNIEGEINHLETSLALYKINEIVNTYFFGILSIQESVKILKLKINTLYEREKIIDSGVRNGLILKSESDRINAEIISSSQKISELELSITKLLNSLCVLLGKKDKSIELVFPELIEISDTVSRIEYKLFAQKRDYLSTIQVMENRKYIPQITAFGQTGYSYPGLNYFENQSDAYYIVGTKLAWNIFDWNVGKKEIQLLEIKKKEINIAREDFDRNLQISIMNKEDEIQMLQNLLDSDKKIIKLKKSIAQSSASSLDNGTITTVDYLTDLNTELMARINYLNHKIRLIEAKADLALMKGIYLN